MLNDWGVTTEMKNNLKDLRDRLNLTQKAMCEILGVAITTYSGYETGYHEPRSDFWVKVSDAFGVTVEYLMGRTNDPYKKITPTRELTQEEKNFLDLFNLVPDEDKPMIINMIRAALQSRGLLPENKQENK